ncbi:HDOD domain-containing protein [Sulfurimonas sp.]|uniref:HDOD domain-containing protein n=1 Tax=Sulfurimonas sp. TaxID=2022749 RepID=UPI0025D8BB0F|nr:HDOD domain-containing protein [Sulfurimonas sp.]
MKNSIVDSIKSLPPLSKTILDINKVYSNEEASIQDLAKVIEHDPMIVANLLKVANSPLYSFGREIRNVAQAVSLFGMGMTRTIALGNAVRKLLNVDMQPYGISSDKFANISSMQAAFIQKWYKQIDKEKADKLFLCAFLQETGKILIASAIIEDDETISFKSEIQNSNNLAIVEKVYMGVTASEITAEVFEHWGFEKEFIQMIKFADNPEETSDELKEYSRALNIVKTIIPVNQPLSERSINFGLKLAEDAGYKISILQNVIEELTHSLSQTPED